MGPTGSGKTMSALYLGFGIGGKIGVIDTENGSADLYADTGDYDVITLEKPYTVASYRAAIQAFEDAGYNVIIVDSLSHAWAGSGGLLDKQGQIAKRNPSQNSYTAWREVTPEHNALVEALLTSPAHIIATMRVKTEYVLEVNEKGKQVPRKVGLQPVQRDGLEYEFTVCMDIDAEHRATASKDRTRLFDGWSDTITERTGKKLLEWLESGEEVKRVEAESVAPTSPPPPPAQSAVRKKSWAIFLDDLQMNLSGAESKADSDAILESDDVAKASAALNKTDADGNYLFPDAKDRFDDMCAAAIKRFDPFEEAVQMASEP
jgi:streptogramin lyase